MKCTIFKRSLVNELYQNIDKNINSYKAGDFSDLLSNPIVQSNIIEIDNIEVDEKKFTELQTDSGGSNDAHNIVLLHEAIPDLDPYLASDERIWVALTHSLGCQFSAKRWLSPEDNPETLERDIKSHFFVGRDLRGLHRRNALASLWWWGWLAKGWDEVPFQEAVEIFVTKTDFRSTLIERPTTTRISSVFKALLRCAKRQSALTNGDDFFKREGGYRDWLRRINQYGGKLLFASMPVKELEELFWSLRS